MPGRGSHFHSGGSRELIVFISCPGDMAPAKEFAEAAVLDCSARLEHLGVALHTWTCERDTTPCASLHSDGMLEVRDQMPAHFDVYLGLLGAHIGTPTPRAISGTVEEFEIALARKEKSGYPHILFYIQRTASPSPEVVQFRHQYPGNYFPFTSLDELKRLVSMHLLDVTINEVTSERPLRRRLASDWVVELSALLNEDFVERCLSRAFGLWDLAGKITSTELDILVAACFVVILRRGQTGETQHAEAIIRRALPQVAHIVLRTADRVIRGEAVTDDTAECRSDLVAAILSVALALGADGSRLRQLDDAARADFSLDDWLDSIIEDISVWRSGIVDISLVLPASNESDGEVFSRAANVRFDLAWQQWRRVLTHRGFVLARNPTKWRFTDDPPANPETIKAIRDTTKQRAKKLTELSHLGESAGPAQVFDDLSSMLPLPLATITEPIQWQLPSEHEYLLQTCPRTAEQVWEAWNAAEPDGEFSASPPTLDPAHFAPDQWVFWTLWRDDGDFPTLIRAGIVRTPTAAELELAHRVSQVGHSWQGIQIYHRLGLRSELLCLWNHQPRNAVVESITPLIRQYLEDAFEWTRSLAAQTRLVETYREACLLVDTQLQGESSCHI